ncbi:hypothetical protein [Paenibacillus larvae]|uniref:hypothetical protein n=2 Tax=Paenibacillus TaxID=44249 RepID=UPI00228281C9|nr:hypothetical protein [Paenibacillus larvae]MEB8593753.1 hypothetical protein [Bacillus cereus]MCY7521037.1 hypothetical protein [Paenibacillus larvae]MCY9500685.1 hypothetical protein [Paenibacillus larvae]MCY9677536.1 hypothetical protein [Paenibacillus larvae]MCY9744717.1 hypothetical protein [Paenibacillus larvae]
MSFLKSKIIPILTIIAFLAFTYVPSLTHAASAVLDTDGNPVLPGQNYKVKVQVFNGTSYNWYFWKMAYSADFYRWVYLSHSSNQTSPYKFDGNGDDKIYEGKAYKMVLGDDGQYLHYQGSSFWYPNGGIYLGDKYGSINFTLNKTKVGYVLTADDGPLYADPFGYQGSWMVASDNGTSRAFSVEFVKQ